MLTDAAVLIHRFDTFGVEVNRDLSRTASQVLRVFLPNAGYFEKIRPIERTPRVAV
jgi:hypothetical protein